MSNESENEFDRKLMALAAKMPTGIAPSRDLWPGIEQAILPPAKPLRGAWNSVWAQAAAVVLLVAGSSGITYLSMQDRAGINNAPIVTVDEVFGIEPVSGDFGLRFTLGDEYMAARNELETGLEKKLDALGPETRADVLKNLLTIRLAIKEINEALAEEPDNVLLQELLLSTYHEEMGLMMRVDGIANSVMRRDDI